jgi:hypothetical protein
MAYSPTLNPQPISGSQTALSSTSWTSATSANTANTISVTGYNTVTVALVATSTFTGGIVTFEVSPDGTNWFPVAMARIDSYTVELAYTIVASTNRAWSTSVDGFTSFRVRLSTAITGTGTLTTLITAQTMAIEPVINAGATMVPAVSGGLSVYHLVSAATTNATVVKNSPGQLYGWYIYNNHATLPRKLNFHNSASTPTAGASIFFSIIIPPGSGANVFSETGVAFSAGIGITTVTDVTDAGTTAVALNDLTINLFYK